MDELLMPLLVLLRLRANRLRSAVRDRLGGDEGVSTLEMVIIALGLMTVAGLLVAALTVAVTSRTNNLK